ncbi:MAG: quinone-dependent dihydroorotate dehydrogenase [Bacteroidota bacterium]
MYKFFLKPLLFSLAPEKAHKLTIKLFKIAMGVPLLNSVLKNSYSINHPTLKQKLFGLEFKNPVGLAAGFDKDAQYFDLMSNLGFGFIEIGTVTPKGQVGNPQPRLFRLPKDNALINRMGFNNEGVEATVERLKNRNKNSNVIIGGNIGKNKVTPNEKAKDDYLYCFNALFPYVDYFVVNVSSPNTPNLRSLQDKKPLTELLKTLQKENLAKDKSKPVLLKIAPDLNYDQIDDIISIFFDTKIDGLIVSNTTIDRSSLNTDNNEIETIGNGGLSGKPLKEKSTKIIQYIHQKGEGKIPMIGVGGIESPQDAIEKLQAGASLVQIYTGLVYQGPTLIKSINSQLVKKGGLAEVKG